jgi:gamma-glutamyltranspeptidase/glutathione hydrolase
MAPTMVFDRAGRLVLVAGAAGGGYIDDYIVAQLVGVIAWQLDPAAALAQPHLGVAGTTVDVEANTPLAAQVPALIAMGHRARAVELRSGGQLIQRLPLEGTLRGAGEPRRDGAAIGR